MEAKYPAEVKTFSDPASTDKLNSPSHSDQHIDVNAETTAIETELGINPAGSSATVVLRLDAVDASIASIGTGLTGAWTPTYWDASTGGNEGTFSTAEGRWTKIGNLVTIYCFGIVGSNAGMTAGNDAHIRDLPFTRVSASGSVQSPGNVLCNNMTFNGNLNVALIQNTKSFKISESVSGAFLDYMTVTEFGTGYFVAQFSYFTDE